MNEVTSQIYYSGTLMGQKILPAVKISQNVF